MWLKAQKKLTNSAPFVTNVKKQDMIVLYVWPLAQNVKNHGLSGENDSLLC